MKSRFSKRKTKKNRNKNRFYQPPTGGFIICIERLIMNLQAIKEKAYELMGNRKAHIEREVGGIYYHGERTGKIAITIREYILPNDNSKDEILLAAGYFHDIAKGIEPHPKYGEILTREVLKDMVSDDELNFICNIIALHKSRKMAEIAQNDFVKIFQDADILDHYGTYEIWMNFLYQARLEGNMQDSIKFYDEEFFEMAGISRSLLNFEISKKIFDEKIDFEREFFERLKVETVGGVCYKLH